jgi:hypothetical protein
MDSPTCVAAELSALPSADGPARIAPFKPLPPRAPLSRAPSLEPSASGGGRGRALLAVVASLAGRWCERLLLACKFAAAALIVGPATNVLLHVLRLGAAAMLAASEPYDSIELAPAAGTHASAARERDGEGVRPTGEGPRGAGHRRTGSRSTLEPILEAHEAGDS